MDSAQDITNEKGWFSHATSMETHDDLLLRVKKVVQELKEMHKATPDDTIMMIAHGTFLSYLMALLTNQHHMLPEAKFLATNNSLTIVDLHTQVNEGV